MYQLFTHKTDVMKKLQQLAARGGYSRYAYGTSEPEKLEAMLYKFEDRYGINRSKQQRWRAKKSGEANTEIVLLLDSEKIHFWLMVSPGSGAVVDMEKPQDLTNKKSRLEITGYELVRVQKSDAVRWTWRMTKQNYADFERRILDACRHKNSDHIDQAFWSLTHMPVFSAMRQQAFDLFRLLKIEFRRSHRTEYPHELRKNFYGRFRAAETLSAVDFSRQSARRMDLAEKQRRAGIRRKIEVLRDEISELDALNSRERDIISDQVERSTLQYEIHLLEESLADRP